MRQPEKAVFRPSTPTAAQNTRRRWPARQFTSALQVLREIGLENQSVRRTLSIMNARARAEPDEIQAGKLLADHARYQALMDRKETAGMGYRSWRNCGEYVARIAVLAGGICFFLPLEKVYALAWLGMAMIPFLSIAMEARWRRIHKSASEELAKDFPNGWPTRHNSGD